MKHSRLFALVPALLVALTSCTGLFGSNDSSSSSHEESSVSSGSSLTEYSSSIEEGASSSATLPPTSGSSSSENPVSSSEEIVSSSEILPPQSDSSSSEDTTSSSEAAAKATILLEQSEGGKLSFLNHSSGDEVELGTSIEVVVEEESGYCLVSLKVNGTDILEKRSFVCEEATTYKVTAAFAPASSSSYEEATIGLTGIPRGQNYALSAGNVVSEEIEVTGFTGTNLYNDDTYHDDEIRLGSGKTCGTLTFTFAEEVVIHEVTVEGRAYKSDDPTLKVTLDGSSKTQGYDEGAFAFDGVSTSTLKVETTVKGERFIFTGFTLLVEGGTYVPPTPVAASIETKVTGNGTIAISPNADWMTGDTVTVTATPGEGSYLSSLLLNGESGTFLRENTYSFLLEEESNRLEALFREKSGESEDFSNLYANETIFPDRGNQNKDIDSYYESVRGLKGEELKEGLHDIIKGHKTFGYSSLGQEDWETVDVDPFNSSNFYVIYEGSKKKGYSVNKEHTWAKSHGSFGTSAPAGSDLHNLRGSNSNLNSTRGNLDFGAVDHTSGNSIYESFSWANADMEGNYRDNYFEPKDSWKGDVARIIFYMATRYDGGSEPELEVGGDIDHSRFNDFSSGAGGLHGNFADLYEWATSGIDPVSDYEVNRNNLVDQLYQHNRNPFIDHPEFIVMIYDKTYDGPGALI